MEEQILEKAKEGGYIDYYGNLNEKDVLNPLFWQSLGKACGWDEEVKTRVHVKYVPELGINIADETKGTIIATRSIYEALIFHEINLTEVWDKAIIYLQSLIK